MAFVSEFCVCVIHLGYNMRFGYPLSTYGDSLTCGLQCLAIVAAIFSYGCGGGERAGGAQG